MTISSYADALPKFHTKSHPKPWYLFLALVSLASLSPFVIIPVAQQFIPGSSAALDIVIALNFVGANFHVASTGWFYTDRSMWSHFHSHPVRYLVVPCVLIAVSAALFHFIDHSLRGYLLFLFFSWQLWHFQKQNVGLLSFIAAGTDGVPVSTWERRTLALSAIAGILGLFSLSKIGLRHLSSEFATLHQIGLGVYLLASIAFCIAITKSPALRTNKLRLTCFLFGTSFFLPTFIFTDPISATLSYAIAHGLQYLVFMGFVSVGKQKPIASLITLLGIATLGAFILNAAILAPDGHEFSYGYAAYGAFLGVVMAHFVLDADIWRLREPFQRGYMRKKFYFLFER